MITLSACNPKSPFIKRLAFHQSSHHKRRRATGKGQRMQRWMSIIVWGVLGLSSATHSAALKLPEALYHTDMSRQGQLLSPKFFHNERGRETSIQDFKGRLTLFKIWGTFCEPCLLELKGLQSLRQAFSERELAIVPICVDNPNVDEVRGVLQREGGAELPIYTDASLSFINTLGISGVPFSILVDEEGREIWRKAGGPTPWGHADVVRHFRDMIHAR